MLISFHPCFFSIGCWSGVHRFEMMVDKNDVPDDVAKGGAPGYPLRLEHMLRPLGLDLTAMKRESVKLVRHEDKRVDVMRKSKFTEEQSSLGFRSPVEHRRRLGIAA